MSFTTKKSTITKFSVHPGSIIKTEYEDGTVKIKPTTQKVTISIQSPLEDDIISSDKDMRDTTVNAEGLHDINPKNQDKNTPCLNEHSESLNKSPKLLGEVLSTNYKLPKQIDVTKDIIKHENYATCITEETLPQNLIMKPFPLDALANKNHTCVIGDSLSGKSSLLQWITYLKSKNDDYHIIYISQNSDDVKAVINTSGCRAYYWDDALLGKDNTEKINSILDLLKNTKDTSAVNNTKYSIILDGILATLTTREAEFLVRNIIANIYTNWELYIAIQNIYQLPHPLRCSFGRYICTGQKHNDGFESFYSSLNHVFMTKSNTSKWFEITFFYKFSNIMSWINNNKGNAVIYDFSLNESDKDDPTLWRFCFPSSTSIPLLE